MDGTTYRLIAIMVIAFNHYAFFWYIWAHLSYPQDEILWSFCPSVRPLSISNDNSFKGIEAIQP